MFERVRIASLLSPERVSDLRPSEFDSLDSGGTVLDDCGAMNFQKQDMR